MAGVGRGGSRSICLGCSSLVGSWGEIGLILLHWLIIWIHCLPLYRGDGLTLKIQTNSNLISNWSYPANPIPCTVHALQYHGPRPSWSHSHYITPPFSSSSSSSCSRPDSHTIKPFTSRLILLVTMTRTLTKFQPFEMHQPVLLAPMERSGVCRSDHTKV
jgi:hypothetical protein